MCFSATSEANKDRLLIVLGKKLPNKFRVKRMKVGLMFIHWFAFTVIIILLLLKSSSEMENLGNLPDYIPPLSNNNATRELTPCFVLIG